MQPHYYCYAALEPQLHASNYSRDDYSGAIMFYYWPTVVNDVVVGVVGSDDVVAAAVAVGQRPLRQQQPGPAGEPEGFPEKFYFLASVFSFESHLFA